MKLLEARVWQEAGLGSRLFSAHFSQHFGRAEAPRRARRAREARQQTLHLTGGYGMDGTDGSLPQRGFS